MGAMSRFTLPLLALVGLLLIPPVAIAEGGEICAVYITGIGCPNCAITDPVLLTEFTSKYPDLIIIEYEIYHMSTNLEIANRYFQSYITEGGSGIPFLIFNKEQKALGRFQVLDSEKIINGLDSNRCPLPDGSSIDFKDLDIANLPGRTNIWTKDRVLISGADGDARVLKDILTEGEVPSALEGVEYERIDPKPLPISKAEVRFGNAARIGEWTLQWNGETAGISSGVNEASEPAWGRLNWVLVALALFGLLSLFSKGWEVVKKRAGFELQERQTDYLIVVGAVLFLVGFFALAKNVPPHFLERVGYTLPLPVFTFFIGLIDGFNPCNMFVLTFLLALLFSVSHSRKRIYAVGFSFVFVVFIIYFLFMAAWLNVFRYIGFITPLRVAIGMIALVAGVINCKELLFFRKGITLMIQDRHKGPLVKKIEDMREVIKKGSFPVLISSSMGLAVFASLVELPCTAGFPIIYTGILSGKMLENTLSYYSYLLLYNLVYVTPLAVLITIFGHAFREKQITKRQMQIIKFVGGLIMILLGIVLLINPALIGIGLA